MPWLCQVQPKLPYEDVVSFALNHCNYDPDTPIYHDLDDPNRTISHRQAKDHVRRLVAGFRKAGLRRGDCFSVTSFNDIMFSMLFLGGVGAGGIFSGMNPAYRAAEVRHHVKTADVKFFICEPEFLEPLLQVLQAEVSDWREKLFVFDTRPEQVVPSGLRSWRWLFEQGSDNWDVLVDEQTVRNTEVSRLTTSGTTGPPKFAMQSHFNGTSYHTLISEGRDVSWEPRALSVLPSFHVATVPAVHVSPLHSGHKIWIMRRFELEEYLKAIQTHQITDLGMAPPLVIAIINSPLTKKYSLKSVRRIGCGAAPLDAESQNRLQALCANDCVFTQVWGMTETTSALSIFRYPEMDSTGSVGNIFLPGTDVKLVDDDGKDITEFDTRGEICVRGPTIVKGYLNNAKANAESWDEEGYFHTGDILYCDRRTKKWYVVDRKKELIKVRGFQVAPPELEGLLLSHPDIADCAVIGVPGKSTHDERPRAYVVKQSGAKLNEEVVRSLVKENLASYKALSGGVVFVSEIPKSPSGKILKRILREQAVMEMKDVQQPVSAKL
ncbi:Acyl-CoA synthetase actt5 [Lithohypha guttulata]|uniref:Acyl-CoA synthetase actt5 n=1 Tax=Lithohypha guttulata TaxID=1690604 RepID=A0AAN7Y7J5_9EURO|nr:Acyl-CoA synthetase actt5 [Lithohypha guttulata]